jgi:hypothetical protein
MSDNRRVIRTIRPAEAAFDEQFWPVTLAMLVLGGFTIGTISAYLRTDDARWYANAWTWCFVCPLVISALIGVLRRVRHRTIRRSVQFSVITGLVVHLILFVVFVETDVFTRYRREIVFAPQIDDSDQLVEPDYQDFQMDNQQRVEQFFEQPAWAETPDPDLVVERRAAREEVVVEPTPQTVELDPLTPRSNMSERRQLEESVPRFSEQPAERRRTLAEAVTPSIEQVESPARNDARQPLEAASRQLPRREPTAALTPAEAELEPRHETRQNQPRQRRTATGAPRVPDAVADRLPRQRSQRQTTVEDVVAPAEASKREAPRVESQDQLRRSTQTAADAPPAASIAATNPTPQPAAATMQRRRENRAPASATDSPVNPLRTPTTAPNSTAAADATQTPRTTAETTIQPSQLAMNRALSGSAGIGQSPNLDRVAAAAPSPSTIASGRAQRARSAQSDPRGPALTPSSRTLVPREVGQAPESQSSLAANIDTPAPLAGSRQPADRVASSAATLEQQAADAARAPVTVAEGTAEVDLGPPRVIGEQGNRRPAGGGQPEIRFAEEMQRLAAADSSNSPGYQLARRNPPEMSTTTGAATTNATEAARSPDQLAAGSTDSTRRSASAAARQLDAASNPGTAPPLSAAASRAARRSPGLNIGKPRLESLAASGRTQRAPRSSPSPLGSSASDLTAGAPDPGPARSLAIGGSAASAVERRSAPAAAGIALERELALGPSGLARSPAVEPGVRSRRASRDSTVLQLPAARFRRRKVGGPPAAAALAVRAAPPFAARSRRLTNEAMPSGTGPETEKAIELGLAFLARNQLSDGRWSLQSFDGDVPLSSDTAATGLSLLAFLGAGYHHREHVYADAVRRGVESLLRGQQENGDLFIPLDEQSNQSVWLYSHAIAALALTEVFGMTQDTELREPAQRAVDFVVQAQDQRRGGWRYTPGYSSDTSVTGWMWMCLRSARLANLRVPDATFTLARGWLDDAQASSNQPHLYRYNPFAPDTLAQGHGRLPTPTMTAVGMLLRLYDGASREDPVLRDGAKYLAENPPRLGSFARSERDTYYWYYATQVMFHMGGNTWRDWNQQLRPLLIDSQIQSGADAGSWDPLYPIADRWAPHAGRLYVTTMNLLSLEVQHRHLPLYDDTGPR